MGVEVEGGRRVYVGGWMEDEDEEGVGKEEEEKDVEVS